MKSLAARSKAPPRGVQRKAAHPPPAQCRGGDAHEAQAEAAAWGFVHGHMQLARSLTPAPAAGFGLTASVGEPLPGVLRGELELAFGADFGEVRIHRDAPAQRAAEAMGALAFASGADLYFAAGRFEPQAEAGRSLIAHELAHSLQQAARASVDGHVRVVQPGSAAGAVQRQNGPTETPQLQQQRYSQLVAAHRGGIGAGPTDASFDAAEQLLRVAFDGRIAVGSQPVSAQPLVADVMAGTHDGRSIAARGLMCDVFKATGYHDAALHLIDSDTGFAIRTLFELQSFQDFLLAQPNAQDWAARALYVRTELRRFWPSVLVADLTAFVYEPRRSAQPNAALAQAFDERRRAWTDHTLSGDGDRVRNAWRLLIGLDQDRVRACNELQQQVDRQLPGFSPTSRRVEVARRLRNRYDAAANDATVPAYQREVAGLLARRARQAVEVFEPVLAALEQGFAAMAAARDTALFDPDAQPLLGRPVTHPLGAVLQALMLARLVQVVPLQAADQQDSADFPDSATYAQRLMDYGVALSTASTNARHRRVEALDVRLDQALYAAASAAAPDMRQVRELALLMAVIDALKALLLTYSPAQDDLTPHFADERRAHAVRLARAHAQVGVMLGWPALVAAAQPYLQTSGAQLHLVGEWEPDARSHPSRMEGDFAANINRRVLRDAPLTVRHIARWFRLEHRQREKALLLGLLTDQRNPRVDTQIPWEERMALVTHSQDDLLESMLTAEQVLAMQRDRHVDPGFTLDDPQRFVVNDFDVTAPADFGANWSEVIERHPKTDLLLGRRPEGGVFIFPEQIGSELFGWITPDLRPLLDFLVNSPVFADQLASGVAADPLAWLNSLMQGDALDEAINRAINAELEPLDREVPMLWRALTTYRRRVLVLQSVQKLDEVIAHPPHATDPSYLWPEQVADEVVKFESTIRPANSRQNDTDIQMALLTMGIAVQLSQLFSASHTRERAANQFYQYVLLALRVLRDSSRREEVRAVTHEDEALHQLYDDTGLTAGLLIMLQAAQRAMEENARSVRDSRGFEVVENKRGLVPTGRATAVHVGRSNAWVLGAPVLPSGEVDESRGTVYYIQEIYEEFSYFPPYGSPTPPSLRAGAGGVYVPPRLMLNGEEVDLSNPDAIVAAREHTLLLLSIDEVPTPVTAGDIDMLNEINSMVLGRSVQISMNRLAAMSEAWMQAIIAGAEFFFPEAAYAETVLNVATFVASDEFEEIARQLKDDPQALLERVFEFVRGRYLTPDAIWRFILLGGQHPLFRTLSMARTRAAGRIRATGTLARVLRGLRSLGQKIHRAVDRLREYTRPPLRAVEGNLMQRPKLVWVLHKALMLAELVADLLPSDFDFELPDLSEIPGDLSENLQHLVSGLARLELPDQIFDNAAAVRMLVEFVLSRMGWRGKAISFVLSHTPVTVQKNDNSFETRYLLDDIGEQVAQGLINHSSADPNNLWRDLLPEIQGQFHTARDDLADGIIANVNALFMRINPMLPAGSQFAPVVRPQLQDMEIIPTPIDDGADLYREPALPAAARTPPLARTSGRPLAGGTLRFYESRLGRDLSHVRLHGGPEGLQATGPLAAEALTSGSHVYLNPRLATGSLRERHVLGHELAHVVQQTQPGRPGQGMPPRRGQPGLGVRAHRASERAADNVASAVSASRHVSQADLAAGPRSIGVQPAVSAEVLDHIVEEITKVSGPADFEMRPTAGAGRVPGVATANTIWNNARAAISAATGAENFVAFMRDPDEVKGLAIGQIISEAASRITPHIAGIAQLAQRPLSGPRPDTGPTTELNPGRFITLLESFIFATRGISLQLTLGPNNSITRVRFTNVHLAWVGGTHRLWTIAFERAYPTASVRDRETMQREVRQLLTVLGPQPFIWASSEFALSASFKRRLEEDREARRRGADNVPPKTEYLQTESTRADNLSISTHGNLTRRGIGAFSRESHHTTQYLLAEYFGDGGHGRQQAFPRSLRNVLSPGVTYDADGSVSAINSGSSTLNVGMLDPDSGRGSNMPAILLAATTHQRGDVHVTPTSDWRVGADGALEAHGSPTQGAAIKNQFNNALDAVGLAMRDDSPATRTRITTAVRADRARVEREIYSAAVATYHWMHERMIGRLKEGLRGEERAYYRRIAARHAENLVSPDSPDLKSEYDLNEGDMDRVWERARANNDRVMSAAGWPTP
jgi:hypothetical protein